MANQTTTTVPWDKSRPYLIDAMQELQAGYRDATSRGAVQYQGNRVAGTNPLIDAARAGATDYLANGAADSWVNAQTQAAGDLMSGGYYMPVEEQWRGVQLSPEQMNSVRAQGASAGQVGINYNDAANRILSGEVNNPYLRNYVQGMLDQTSQEFGETTMANLRSGGIGAGQRSSSRQGIAEGLAASRFGQDLNRTANQFYSNAYDQAQGRASDMALGLSGQDTQRAIATAGNQTQASVASANNRLSGLLANQKASMDAQQMSLDAQRANQSSALDSGRLSLGALGLAPGIMQQRLGIYDALGKIGDQYRADEQGLLDSAYNTWNDENNRVFNLAKDYYSSLTGLTNNAGRTTTSGSDDDGSDTLDIIGKVATIAGTLAQFSDINLKTDITPRGRVNGFNWYTWTWNEKAKELGLSGDSEGVIAQEVEVTHPDLVTVRNGYKAVNYAGVLYG